MSATIYLVRHATPDWSRTDLRYDIPPGPPLTEQGAAEAGRLGLFLREAGVQKLYASPLERTRHTAQLAAEMAEADVVEAQALAEWQRGENEAGVLERFLPFWDAIVDESSREGAVALVSHGGPIRLMLQYLKLDRAEIDYYRKLFDRDNPVPPAGAWRVQRAHADAEWCVELVFAPQPFQPYEPQTVHV